MLNKILRLLWWMKVHGFITKWMWVLKIRGKKWRTSRETPIRTRDKKSRIELEMFLSRTEVPYKDVALNRRINGGWTIPYIQRRCSEFCAHMESFTFGAWLCTVLKLGRFGQHIRNTWKVLKCGVVERWRRSVGPIMWEMKKYYLESMSRGISYMK